MLRESYDKVRVSACAKPGNIRSPETRPTDRRMGFSESETLWTKAVDVAVGLESGPSRAKLVALSWFHGLELPP